VGNHQYDNKHTIMTPQEITKSQIITYIVL
jgi:hypothetical protein